jgi:hypothetical protein
MNVCEHTISLHHLNFVFTYIHALLIEKDVSNLLLQYYVNNHYSDFICMSMHSSELSDLGKHFGKHDLDLLHTFL